MNNIASEKEKILKQIEAWHRMMISSLYTSPEIASGYERDELKYLYGLVDHIASVARQEGREEAIEEIKEEVEFFKVDYTDPDGSYPIVSIKSIDYILAKLTGKEEEATGMKCSMCGLDFIKEYGNYQYTRAMEHLASHKKEEGNA